MLWERFGHFFYDWLPARRLPSLKLEWMLTTANAAGTNSLMCLRKYSSEELEITNFGHSDDWRLRTLLTFHVRTPSALSAGPSRSSIKNIGFYCTIFILFAIIIVSWNIMWRFLFLSFVFENLNSNIVDVLLKWIRSYFVKPH
jgi:hypothetical protein